MSASTVPAPSAYPLRLGDVAPDFSIESTDGPFNFHKYIDGHWAIFFSHPADFTPVCTTELGMVAKLKGEWAKRDVRVIGLSVDSVESHAGWVKDIEETQGTALNFPLLADPKREVAKLYWMLDERDKDANGLPMTVRSVFVIDKNKKIRLTLTYPASTGRNFDEIIRCVDSLQLTDKHKLATPVNWKQGEECVIVPAVTNEQAKTLFPQGWKEVKPYLRLTTPPTTTQ